MNGAPSVRRTISTAVLVLAALAVLVLPVAASHGPSSHVEVLGRSAFTDEVAAQFRVGLDGDRTHVVNVGDASDVLTVRQTLDDGAIAPWHTHPGPVLVSVVSGTLTYVNASDCVARVYPAGTAFVDPGQGNVHTAWATGDTVLVATFLGVDGPPTVPAAGPEGCDPYP